MNDENRPRTLREVENDYIAEVLDSCGGDKPKAARILDVSVKTICNRLRDMAALKEAGR